MAKKKTGRDFLNRDCLVSKKDKLKKFMTVLKSFKKSLIWAVSEHPSFITLEVMILLRWQLKSGFLHFWMHNFELKQLLNEEELSILLSSIL